MATHILGISCFYHDSAACLLRDGEIVAAAQEERFTRKKHDNSFPGHAVRYCLEEGGIEAKDLEFVGFYEKPFLKFERILETHMGIAPRGVCNFFRAIPLWLGDRLFIRTHIQEALSHDVKVLFCQHHESHAASAFYPSPFREAAILTLDAMGEWNTTSYGVGSENEISLLKELNFPHSLGMLYSAFTYYVGFRVNSGEYKLMGLAPYGEPKYADLIRRELIDIKEDGSFNLNMKYFGYLDSVVMIKRRFEELFGRPARKAETRIEQHHMDLARSVQEVTEEVILRMARHIHKESGRRNLCMAGGVALNCVANGKVLRETPFERLFVQPAAGDAGGALGVALFLWHRYLGRPRAVDDGRRDSMKAALLGPQFSDDEIKSFLKEREAPYEYLPDGQLCKRVAQLVADENVIGWFQGRMEFGPRALGSRSILGDARSPKMQSVMNLKIKFRESFRPFAPTVLEEKVSDYFDLDRESPYMLLVAPVRKDKRREMTPEEQKLFGVDKVKVARSAIPAVTHVDYSARVQTVSRHDNPRYHELICEFEKLTGCSVIVNTSFNVRGEPIVCTPEHAFMCFMRTQMDYLVLNNFLVAKRSVKPLDEDIDWRTLFEPD